MITETDKQRFLTEGVLRVDNVVPEQLCRAVRTTVSDYLQIDPDDPATWPDAQRSGHGLVPIYHAQSLWDVRQYPAVHQVFAALHETDQLWVSIDRASFKTPDPQQSDIRPAEPIHWDGHPGQSRQQRSIQGLLYLTDTTADQGAFCCVPELFQHLDDYLQQHPEHGDSRRPIVDPQDIRVVDGQAGSLVLWDRRMPHSSTINLSSRPRWVQYLAMDPSSDETTRKQRRELFEQRMLPDWALAQKVPGQIIPEPGGPAQLSNLGRKLVGLDRW